MSKSKSQLLELGICTSIFLIGWNIPSSLLNLTQRDIPYQIIGNGDNAFVLLDLSLNHPAIFDVTIPSSLLLALSIWLPIATILFIELVLNSKMIHTTDKQNKYTLTHSTHAALCALLVSLGCSEFLTQVLKLYVGRLRPNFYSLCEFNLDLQACNASDDHIREARMSFPSGHSSLSFSGLGILCFYLLGRFGAFNSDTANTTFHLWEKRVVTLLCTIPLLLSTYTASSRIVDNWHHVSDVIAGVCIGLVCSFCCYHLWFCFLFSSLSGIPLCNL